MYRLKLYNTLTRKIEEFKPISNRKVGLYTCGPTVYDYAHIGNLRSYIFADILKRALLYNKYDVNHVMNITDVGHLTSDADTGEDKMEKGSQREGKTVWDIARFYTESFKKDINRLNILEPNIWCKATDHIEQQIKQIKKIETNGFAYKTSTGLYFDTGKLKDYGKLAQLNLEGLKEGARIGADSEKRNPTDFALWKFSPTGKKRQMEWDSPWGKGFPGWHIECSAMSVHYLGAPFDIHTGGIDHIPVHHTNEIAQTEGAEGKIQANWWLHGEFLNIDKGRMGKSEGNLLTLNALVEKGFEPLAYRYFTFSAHYRKPLTFSWEGLTAAQTAYKKLIDYVGALDSNANYRDAYRKDSKIICAQYEQNFLNAVNSDLNIPEALAVTWNLLKSDLPDADKKATIVKFDQVLGLDLDKKIEKKEIDIPPKINKLIKEREQARKEKDFQHADQLRKQIEEAGFALEDSPKGTIVK